MEPLSLLIIDDHKLIRETLSYFFSGKEEYHVIGESSGGEPAIELAKLTRPKIVLLDINMEPIDGFEVLTGIRKVSPGSKIIVVSIHSEPPFIRKMLRAGAKGYVAKNSPLEELVAAIEEVNRGNRYLSENVKKILEQQEKDQPAEVADQRAAINSLSARELQIAKLIYSGKSSKIIAAELYISIKTVVLHRHNVLQKLKVKNTLSLVNYIRANAIEL